MFSLSAAITPGAIQQVTLPSAEDFDLAVWLAGEGITGGSVEAYLPAGEVIGGTVNGAYAFEVGDISAFDGVAISIEGQVHGKGAAAGDGNDGSHGLHSDYPVQVTVVGNGEIRGGGSSGGKGGTGGSGFYYNMSTWRYNRNPENNWRNPTATSNTQLILYWDDSEVHRNNSWPQGQGGITGPISSNYYERGSIRQGNGGSGSDSRYEVRRGPYVGTSGGSGGNGGPGKGYNQDSAVGSSGSSGGTGAGAGGQGGWGGNFDASGNPGNTGLNGNVGNGSAGTSAGTPGIDINIP